METLHSPVSPAHRDIASAPATAKNPVLKFALVLILATVIAAIGSHVVAVWCKIKVKEGNPFTFGDPNGRSPAYLAGSSLADYGLSWNDVSTQTATQIKVWGIAGGSPYEWEQFQRNVPDARTTYLVVSAYDLDEAMICDYRADLVPLTRTIQTLRAAQADWAYTKRALTQYPLTWLRVLFPTIGRSRGIMGKLRENIAAIIKRSPRTSETEAGPTLEFGKKEAVDEYKLQRMSDWSKSKILGKIAAMRAGIKDEHGFSGLKHQAFQRMLEYGCERGRTIVIVLPVSESYSQAFMSPEMTRKFENGLAEAGRRVPHAEWLRLDQVPSLASDANFCDLVHMNIYGKKTATEALQGWLQNTSVKR